MTLFGRLAKLFPFRRRRLALPAPEEASVLTTADEPPTIPLPDQSDADLAIPPEPGSEAPAAGADPVWEPVATPDEPSPVRARAPPDPARRARYFGIADAPTGQDFTPRPPAGAAQRGQTTTRPLPLQALATSIGGVFDPSPTPRIEAVEPIRFSAFLNWPEDAPETPPEAAGLWRTEPTLLAQALALRDAVLAHAAGGGTPLRPLPLFDMAMRETGHPATSLLACHLVTRAFARGGEAVTWRCVDRRRGVFSDGVRLHRPAQRAAVDEPAASAYYALFAASALGVEDPGDWYRFFALACVALLAASGGCLPPQPIAENEALRFAERVDQAVGAIAEAEADDAPAARGWRWANALVFVEHALWGRSDARARDAGRMGLAAAAFGLRMAGATAGAEWRWAVPRAGGWRSAPGQPAPIEGWLARADGLAA
jgi:hypothetical protein